MRRRAYDIEVPEGEEAHDESVQQRVLTSRSFGTFASDARANTVIGPPSSVPWGGVSSNFI